MLAVLGLGLYLRTYSPTAVTSGGWLLGRAVVGTLILFRFAWIFPAVWLERLRSRRKPGEATPSGNRETVVTA